MVRWFRKQVLLIVRYLCSRLLILFILIGLFGAAIGISVDFLAFLKAPITVKAGQNSIEIVPGMSIDRLANALQDKKIIKDGLYFKWYGRLTGQARQIKAGEYALTPGMVPQEMLTLFTSGKSIQYSFTLIEGWTFKQMLAMMQQSPYIKQTLEGLTPEAVMIQLGLAGQPYEGYFLPETYLFPKNYSDQELLKRSYEAMQSVLKRVWTTRDLSLPIKDPHELLTLASIIEKETGLASERPEISGVFVRRLKQNMRLQTDPTVIYGLGERYTGTIYRSNLTEDTPYNTYTRDGLPPTPIAMPSAAAIYAAANPKSGDSLYFVAKGDGSGSHVFSNTLEAHNKAVRAYRQRRQ